MSIEKKFSIKTPGKRVSGERISTKVTLLKGALSNSDAKHQQMFNL